MNNDEDSDNVKTDIQDAAANLPATPASFKGRLDLTDFSFSPKLDSNDSQSPEKLGFRQPSPFMRTPSRTPTKSSPKRKLDCLSPSSSPKKSKSQGYAPPSTYAHLPGLVDVLEPDLLCVFVGLNPGVQTARLGHAYAHPSNRFWKLLHSSGCTTRQCRPAEDRDMPRLFSLGLTNIVSRPTRNESELSKTEMDAGVQILEEKVRKFNPEAVCIVGKSIWQSIWRVRHGKSIKKDEFKFGWQNENENMGIEEGREGSRVFVATSSSGLAASLLLVEKERIWRELGLWVETRRAERGLGTM